MSTTADELADWDESVKSCLRHAGRDDPIASLPDHGAPPAEPHEPLPVPAPGVSTGRDGWVAESRHAFIKFAGLGHDRAPLTDTVLNEITRSAAFKFGTYPAGQGHPWRVEDGATIFVSRMTSGPNDMRVIGRATAIAHDPDHDMASPEEIKRRDWPTHWPYLIRVHNPQFIDGTLRDGGALSALIDELGPLCFQSTKRRVRAGEQNVNPRRSVRQKADVELSDEGFAWMTQQFDPLWRCTVRSPQNEFAPCANSTSGGARLVQRSAENVRHRRSHQVSESAGRGNDRLGDVGVLHRR